MVRSPLSLTERSFNLDFEHYVYSFPDEQYILVKEKDLKTPVLSKQISSFDNVLCVWKHCPPLLV